MGTNMSGRAIATGALLMALGLLFYTLAARESGAGKPPSPTAMIPAIFGLPILACGLIGRQATRRKHAMHGAATFALLGAIGGLSSRAKWPLILTGQNVERPLAAWETLLMFLICAGFVFLCAQSFRAARRAV